MARRKTLTKDEAISLGVNLSRFPGFSATGSITGMKRLYYGEDALLVRCGGFIYHVGNATHNGKSIYHDLAK